MLSAAVTILPPFRIDRNGRLRTSSSFRRLGMGSSSCWGSPGYIKSAAPAGL